MTWCFIGMDAADVVALSYCCGSLTINDGRSGGLVWDGNGISCNYGNWRGDGWGDGFGDGDGGNEYDDRSLYGFNNGDGECPK